MVKIRRCGGSPCQAAFSDRTHLAAAAPRASHRDSRGGTSARLPRRGQHPQRRRFTSRSAANATCGTAAPGSDRSSAGEAAGTSTTDASDDERRSRCAPLSTHRAELRRQPRTSFAVLVLFRLARRCRGATAVGTSARLYNHDLAGVASSLDPGALRRQRNSRNCRATTRISTEW